MSKLIKSEDGCFVLSSEIIKVQKRWKGSCLITTNGGQTYILNQRCKKVKRSLDSNSDVIIPALPGFFVAYAFEHNDHWEALLYPIIGWSKGEVAHDEQLVLKAIPIVPDLHYSGNECATVYPNGKIKPDRNFVQFDSVNEWLVSVSANDKFKGE